MPLYDYRCKTCHSTFELLVRNGTVPLCPHCGAGDPERQLSLPAPQGASQGLIAAGRRAAAKEGHFSHYSRAERAKLAR